MLPQDPARRTVSCLMLVAFVPVLSAAASACLTWLPLIMPILKHPPVVDLVIHLVGLAVAMLAATAAAACLPLRTGWRVAATLAAIPSSLLGYGVSSLITSMLIATLGNALY